MYLIPICVPVFADGPELLVATDWKRALELLRDSLEGRYGDLLVLAPRLPADGERAREQPLTRLHPGDGIALEAAHDGEVRARHFWRREALPYRALLADRMRTAQVVHSGLDELYRPMMTIAFGMALRRRIPTVFVQDTDEVVQVPELAGASVRERIKARVYAAAYERVCRSCVARADLSLLKGEALMERYASYARNARQIENTSFLTAEIVPRDVVDARLATLGAARPLRLVYCGRLVARKGLLRSLGIVRAARDRGAQVELDLIGGGPDEAELRAQVGAARLDGAVRLLGRREYGRALLRELAGYDALLFTPTAEDTPRMIFDGYAAGLPLIATSIPYVEQRARNEGAAIVLPADDLPRAAQLLADVDAHRQRLVPLSRAAHAAAHVHSADAWYRLRAAWTHEAVERARAESGGSLRR